MSNERYKVFVASANWTPRFRDVVERLRTEGFLVYSRNTEGRSEREWPLLDWGIMRECQACVAIRPGSMASGMAFGAASAMGKFTVLFNPLGYSRALPWLDRISLWAENLDEIVMALQERRRMWRDAGSPPEEKVTPR